MAPAPNPFASSTRLTYTLSNGGRYRLTVYDVQGREVAALAEGLRQAGSHTLNWDGRDRRGAEVPSGVYFLRLEHAGQVKAQKLVIAR
jgi:flagellar hook assembly protein FlgD